MDEISTVSLLLSDKASLTHGLSLPCQQSFCFICLLHLANENGLSIKATEEQDLEKAERAIGGLVDLQINRQ